MNVLLEAKNVKKVYENGDVKTKVINSLNLQIHEKEFVVIMGPSGSGKSTLLHLLSTMVSPTSGTITYNGESITGKSDSFLSKLRRTEFGFIFQNFNLFPAFTAIENVAVPLLLNKQKVDNKKIVQLLEIMGIEHIKDSRSYQMSGGQQQRVAIARSLIHDPNIIFADEPTGSLDSKSGEIVLDIIRNIVDVQGKTVVMVTHDPRVEDYADRVIRMKDGCIVENTLGGAKIYG